ncbi:hypothetical protein BDV93DRAFT_567375 [Ceratobasidium sp. AG-I]|nr:hypothetical protein BDV93DRAFT_567375 [Ceratobasidium sp. AG-I]
MSDNRMKANALVAVDFIKTKSGLDRLRGLWVFERGICVWGVVVASSLFAVVNTPVL